MAGLSIPQDFPLNSLVGQELIQICIGRHNLRMNFNQRLVVVGDVTKFHGGANIDVEAGFRLFTHSGQVLSADNSDLASATASLVGLLGQTITNVQRLPNNELLLHFANDAELILIVDSQGFESYHLHVDGQSVDVTKCW